MTSKASTTETMRAPERDLIAAEAVRVSAPVEMLVMMFDDEPHVFPRVDVGENRRADLGMGAHDVALGGGQCLGFAKQRLGNGHLADVMEARAETDDAAHAVADAEVASDGVRHPDEPRRVLLRLVVLRTRAHWRAPS